jgi:hypothetical protein
MKAAAALALVVVCALLSATADATRVTIGPYRGTATGGVDRHRHIDNQSSNPDSHIVGDSDDSEKGHFTYTFRLDNGVITGTGNGDYSTVTWHLEGTNGNHGHFSCDIPLTVKPYGVRIRGFAADGTLYLRFHIGDEAVETNDEYDCGADYSGFASRTRYLQESLEKAQNHLPGGYVTVDQHHPRIGRIAYVESGTLASGSTYVWRGAWTFTITAPPDTGRNGDRDSGGGAGPGGSTGRNTSTSARSRARRGATCSSGRAATTSSVASAATTRSAGSAATT